MGDNTALKKKQFFSLYQFVNSKALTQGLKKICFVCLQIPWLDLWAT